MGGRARGRGVGVGGVGGWEGWGGRTPCRPPAAPPPAFCPGGEYMFQPPPGLTCASYVASHTARLYGLTCASCASHVAPMLAAACSLTMSLLATITNYFSVLS